MIRSLLFLGYNSDELNMLSVHYEKDRGISYEENNCRITLCHDDFSERLQ